MKDLRFGSRVDEDRSDVDLDEFPRDRCQGVPFLPGAAYHFVATTAAPPAVGALVGDYLVRAHSASGRGKSRRVPFEPEHGLTLTGLHHLDSLNHPRIYLKLREWVTGATAPPATAATQPSAEPGILA